MKQLIIFITALFILTACSKHQTVSPEVTKNRDYYKCRLELYCTRSENSMVKKAAFKTIETYFGTDLDDGICKKHYQAWGYDYRKPARERCGKQSDFE